MESPSLPVRIGAGVFNDWYEADVYEQTLRVNGERQRDLIVSFPGYPDPLSGGVAQQVLPPGKYMLAGDLIMPKRALGLVAQADRRSASSADRPASKTARAASRISSAGLLRNSARPGAA